jgi:coenzyme F420 hydrogenase subunit beta
MLILQNKVINNNYCIGCGACAISQEAAYSIITNKNGCYQAQKKPSAISDGIEASVCPFNNNKDENALSRELFEHNNKWDPKIGYYHQIFAGQVNEGDFFSNGSSGGSAKWLLSKLLEEGYVDKVIQVYNNSNNPDKLFEYRVTDDVSEVKQGSKSVYYPVEMSKVLDYIRQNPGRYAITGVPCFIKSIRLLQDSDPVFKERIKYCMGIFCGHLKSKFYAEMIGWQLGVEPNNLTHIDFRVKIQGQKANEKGVRAKSIDGYTSKPKIVQEVFGTNYGQGFFKYPACDYCDDVIAETADISFGDAWLPEYLEKGTSMVVSRNPELSQIIKAGIANGKIDFKEETAEQVYKSQEGGYRHRREGLTYRLLEKRKKGAWVPEKRTFEVEITKQRRKIYKQRMKLSAKSFSAFIQAKSQGDFNFFRHQMENEVHRYLALYRIKTRKERLIQLLTYLGLINLTIKTKRIITQNLRR